ncbi:MAG: lysostaphin resistance A-like protein [Chitinophagaceae bacterium]
MQQRHSLHPALQWLILVAAWGASFLLGSLLMLLLWPILTGTSIMSMRSNMLDPAYAAAVRWLNVLSTIVIFVVPALVYAKVVRNQQPLKQLRINGNLNVRQVALTALIMGAALMLSGWLAEVNKAIPVGEALTKMFQSLEDTYTRQILIMANMQSWQDFLIAMFVVAIAPAVVEELFFRGAFQTATQQWLKHPLLAILITSFMFSVIHLSWYAFLPRMALGMVLGYIFYYSQNIWLPIIGHFINNALALTQLYLLSSKGKLSKAALQAEINTTMPLWMGLVGLFLVIVLLRQYRKESLLQYANRTDDDDDL